MSKSSRYHPIDTTHPSGAKLRHSFFPLFMAFLATTVGSTICALMTFPDHTVAQTQQHDHNVTPVGDWPQWGGSSIRNNVPEGHDLPTDWDVGEIDEVTGEWIAGSGEGILWRARLGSQSYGNPVVASGRAYVGTNNGAGYLPRYPDSIDLGCLVALDAADGHFLWQHSSEKLPTGRVHDWPLQGICCAPLVESDRLWFVTSRGEVVCVDTEGYYDREDDGPVKAGWLNLFAESPDLAGSLDSGSLGPGIEAVMFNEGLLKNGRIRVTPDAESNRWTVQLTDRGKTVASYRLTLNDNRMVLTSDANENEQPIFEVPSDLGAGLAEGKANPALIALLARRGCPMQNPSITTSADKRGWSIKAQSGGVDREVLITRRGPNLVAMLQGTIDDQFEADEVWVFDMMKQLKVSQHNMCSCSVTALGDILFVNTSNGVDESHIVIPSVDAPSFIALDKNTGQLLWSDRSPGENILHGQWSSPTVATLDGVAQVLFAGGDGWLYSFKADPGTDGKPELLWKFDCNPKTSEWILGGRGTRNNIIATPVVYDGRVYVAVGQDPEHGEGVGHLWCIDPTKRGDISAELAVNVNDRSKPIAHRRIKAVIEENGEVAIDNPNSGVVWHYSTFDQNNDGEIEFEETMHRSCGTVTIKNDLLYIADFSGLLHCLDAKSGKVHWTYDLLAQAWGSPLIVDDKVYIGDEDGEVAVFELSRDAKEPIAEIDMRNSVYSTPIVAHNILYIANKTHLFAISKTGAESPKTSGSPAATTH